MLTLLASVLVACNCPEPPPILTCREGWKIYRTIQEHPNYPIHIKTELIKTLMESMPSNCLKELNGRN